MQHLFTITNLKTFLEIVKKMHMTHLSKTIIRSTLNVHDTFELKHYSIYP